ncbi:hypothetical protein GCM10009760_08200 [Kitasatospora kazusensis]|uniref:Mce-associated membrane protein n=1 Tax=Kitasatospora kazusensis TaxID=407974 RepID=A0ABN2YUV1_9ACTN
MSSTTTRHLINRRRRLAAARPPVPPAEAPASADLAAQPVRQRARLSVVRTAEPTTELTAEPTVEPVPEAAAGPAARRGFGRAAGRRRLPVVLAVLAVLLGGFAAGAAARVAALQADPAAHNLALTDPARTSEVKGELAQAVNTLFSYNYADTARTDTAAKTLLVGKAVQQYASMLAEVRKQAPQQKLVLTTTVTDSGVELIDGDRARLLVFADQRNTSTADSAKPAATSYAAAMFAVDAVRQGGGWRIAGIDTFNQ